MKIIRRTLSRLALMLSILSVAATSHSGEFMVDNKIEDATLASAAEFWLGIAGHISFLKTEPLIRLEQSELPDNIVGTAQSFYNVNEARRSTGRRDLALGLDAEAVYTEVFLISLGASGGEGSADGVITIGSGFDFDTSTSTSTQKLTLLANVVLHEALHLFGLGSRLEEDGAYVSATKTHYDRFAYSGGSYLHEMTQAEREALGGGDVPVYFKGPNTALYGSALYVGGVDAAIGAELTSKDLDIDHLSRNVDPIPVFTTGSEPSEAHVFLAAAMLSDLGLGDMLDTQASQVGEGEDLTLSILTETLQSNLPDLTDIVVTLAAPDGLTLSLSSTGGATCSTDADNALVCAIDNYPVNTAQTIGINTIGSSPGVYEIDVRIDHNAAHVDGNPLNNRLTAGVTVGSNPLSALSIDATSIDEGSASGAGIGSLSVTNSGSSPVVYHLVSGTGDSGNALVSLTEAGVLTVAGTLDHETRPQLSLRVQALAANGFSVVEILTVLIDDTAVDGCLNNVVATAYTPFPLINSAYAGTGNVAAVGVISVLMQLGLWFASLFAGSRVRRSTKLSRGWKVVILAGLAVTLVACGGGGSSAPTVQSC